jgi:aspartyl-tRNA(Asn)/glutamyl-tRNA(Gln) amidotransferase subunit C
MDPVIRFTFYVVHDILSLLYSTTFLLQMALTRDDVRHVAKLARLTLTDAEVDLFTGQLESVFQHLDKLTEVNTNQVEETAQVNGLQNSMSQDIVRPSLDRDAFLNTSQRESARVMIKVRKSIG